MNPALPPTHPLERLVVRDGLLLNAERWQRSHAYHRQRQNLYYQSLCQPGIVYGLGVVAIKAPNQVAAQYRDDRWVQIQSGIAIDALGNPIVVDRPIEFRIASEVKETPLTVYLVLRYVDPEALQRQPSQEFVCETFRIDEKNSPPTEAEVELCRIQLQPGNVQIAPAFDPLLPEPNTVDLCHRLTAQFRSPGCLKVVYLPGNHPEDRQLAIALQWLLRALDALYPQLSAEPLEPLNLAVTAPESMDCDAIALSYQQLVGLSHAEIDRLRPYVDRGSTLLVEAANRETDIGELIAVTHQLQEAIADIRDREEFADIQEDLERELENCQTKLQQQLEQLIDSVKTLGNRLGIPTDGTGQIGAESPLRTQPFLFGQFPTLDDKAIALFQWQNLILVVGELSAVWGVDSSFSRSRETIRSAQELGINLLYFAWRRYQLVQLQRLPNGRNSGT